MIQNHHHRECFEVGCVGFDHNSHPIVRCPTKAYYFGSDRNFGSKEDRRPHEEVPVLSESEFVPRHE
eukprot:scaffold3856_cov169-Amphora_coffeaeformis.AAC.2